MQAGDLEWQVPIVKQIIAVINSALQWPTKPPHAVCAVDTSHLPNVVYELKIAAWDRVDIRGPEFSDRHLLKDGQTIGLAVQFDDVDEDSNKRHYQPGTGGPEARDNWWAACYFNKAVLVKRSSK